MKKPMLMLLAAIMMVALAAGVAMGASLPGFTSAGQPYQCDPQPYFAEDKTMVPVSAVCDLLGINPVFSDAKGSITMTLNEKSITIIPGKAEAVINGESKPLPISTCQKDNYTYVPLRAVAEALGATVTWDAAKNSIDVAAPSDKNQLMVFHAGSLTAPLRDLSIAFKKANPNVNIYRESAGSVDCVTKVTEKGEKADLLVLADYSLFDQMMIPKYASWYAMFAKNEMVLCYRDGAVGSDKITAENWMDTLLAGAKYGHTNPDLDPAGYRALMVWQLAEKHYKKAGLYDQLTKACSCPEGKGYASADALIADLKAGKIDYAFEYLSVAKQNGFKYVTLPAEINLADTTKADFYKQAKVKTASGEQIGLPIVCGLAIPLDAPNPDLAAKFAAMIMGADGQKVMEAAGQTAIAPPRFNDPAKVPAVLKDIK